MIRDPLLPAEALLMGARSSPDLVSDLVAAYLEASDRKAFAFYGCGQIASHLVLQHQHLLETREVCFLDSAECSCSEFMGFPLWSPEALRPDPNLEIILLTLVHEEAMLRRLSGYPGAVTRLVQVLNSIGLGYRQTIQTSLLRRKWEVRIHELRSRFRPGAPRIVIACQALVVKILRLSRALMEQGIEVVLMAANPNFQGSPGWPVAQFLQEGWFLDFLFLDASFENESIMFLEELAIDALYLLTSTGPALPLAWIVARAPCPVYTEYDDILELCFPEPEHYMHFCRVSESEMEDEKEALRILFTESRGLISRHSPEAMAILESKYNFRPSWIPFAPYPMGCHGSAPTPSCVRTADFRIVYAGCLNLDATSNNYPLFHSFLEAARILNHQEIAFTVYNAADRSGKGFEAFRDLAQELPYFEYYPGILEDELVQRLSDHDFGWHVYDFSCARDDREYTSLGLSTKFFYYLDAALPILVSPEISFEFETASRHSVGLGVAFQDLGGLRKRLDSMPLMEMKQNVLRLRDEWSMKRQLPRLIRFMGLMDSQAIHLGKEMEMY